MILFKYIKYTLYLPFLISFLTNRKMNKLIEADLERAISLCKWHRGDSKLGSFMNCICFLPEYRELYINRLFKTGRGKLLRIMYRNKILLHIHCSEIGGGLFLQHAHSTEINAQSIGNNCQIWQNVTIGVKHSGGPSPIIGNNVKICAGACVLGGITIGDNVTIGANAVVLKDVPDNSIAVGVPAKVIQC